MTILMSTLIQETMEKVGTANVVAYFYFDFKVSAKQHFNKFFQSISDNSWNNQD